VVKARAAWTLEQMRALGPQWLADVR
jgi:hypothetical protein